MLEAPIPTTHPLPDCFGWLDRLKTETEKTASYISLALPAEAEQMQHCADWIRLMRFKNGFAKISKKKQRFCRIRGCPICENNRQRKILGRISGGLVKAKQELTSYQWMKLTLSAQSCGVSDLRQAVFNMNNAVQRLKQRKAFKAKGVIRFTNIEAQHDKVVPLTTLFCFIPKSMAAGSNHLSIPKLQALWEECLQEDSAPVTAQYLQQNRKAILNVIGLCGKTDLTIVGKNEIAAYYHAVKHLNMVRFSGVLSSWMADRPRQGKKYYPAELANLAAMKSEYFAYLPNPESEQHQDQFLLYPEFDSGAIVDWSLDCID